MKDAPILWKEMTPITSRIGPLLRKHRQEQGLSIEEVARRAGITPVALHRLETCQSCSLGVTYERVARALELNYALIVHEASVECPS